jgi:hypothetical protein
MRVLGGALWLSLFLTSLGGGPATATYAQIPGLPGSAPGAAEGAGVSDLKLGSVLFFNYYVSDSINPSQVNTTINITNVDPARGIALHIFFVDSLTCSAADSFLCLTRNQTASFMASDIDPDVTGYILVVAVDSIGRPVSFNALAGDALIAAPTGHRFALPAVAVARRDGIFASPLNADGITASMFFNQAQYDALPFVMVLDAFPSQVAGPGTSAGNTLLFVYSPQSNLLQSDGFSGTLFFMVRDDQENTFSGTLPIACYLASDKRRITSIRTSPNINTIVPSGRSGWAAFYGIGSRSIICNTSGDRITLSNFPLMGATATRIGVLNGGHNLRYATIFNAPGYSITIPVIPPDCPSIDAPTKASSLC